MRNKFDELAPCGVFCGACPSCHKTCKGCASEDKAQIRKSKWSCKIRTCCYDQKKLDFCGQCPEFPCTIVNKKLVESHPHDVHFTYRHEIPDSFRKLKSMGVEVFYKYQVQRWKCTCGGTIQFYSYKCNTCGAERLVSYH